MPSDALLFAVTACFYARAKRATSASVRKDNART